MGLGGGVCRVCRCAFRLRFGGRHDHFLGLFGHITSAARRSFLREQRSLKELGTLQHSGPPGAGPAADWQWRARQITTRSNISDGFRPNLFHAGSLLHASSSLDGRAFVAAEPVARVPRRQLLRVRQDPRGRHRLLRSAPWFFSFVLVRQRGAGWQFSGARAVDTDKLSCTSHA
jgi:hypothetical protein